MKGASLLLVLALCVGYVAAVGNKTAGPPSKENMGEAFDKTKSAEPVKDSNMEALVKFADKLRAAKLPGVFSVEITLDPELKTRRSKKKDKAPESPKNPLDTNLIVLLRWNPELPAGSTPKQYSDKLTEVGNKIKDLKLEPNEQRIVWEVQLSAKPELFDSAPIQPRASALLEKASRRAHGRSSRAHAPAKPAVITAGDTNIIGCDKPGKAGGTLGAILKDGAGKYYAFTNAHVIDSGGACTSTVKMIPKAYKGVWDHPTRPASDHYVLTASSPDAGKVSPDVRLGKSGVPGEDTAYVKLTSGLPISCLVNGVALPFAPTGVRPKPAKGFQEDIGLGVFKEGQKTGWTAGKITGFDGTDFTIEGTWPPFPHTMAHGYDLSNPDNIAPCLSKPEFAPSCKPAANAAAALSGPGQGWDPRAFGGKGDSGSVIYDSAGKAVCQLYAGSWSFRDGDIIGLEPMYIYVKCSPMTTLLDWIAANKPIAAGITICTDSQDKITTS